jgi:putative ABC transport system substrate-binding protein
VSDQLRQHIVASLARPGQNVPGTSSQAEDLLGKRLEQVALMLPKGTPIAVLLNTRNPVHGLGWQQLEATAPAFQFRLIKVEVGRVDEVAPAIERAAAAGAKALFVLPDDPLTLNARPQLIAAAAKHRLPDFHWAREFVDSGGLLSYGESLTGSYRAAAGYIDRIRKGADPSTLPVEQPTRFELVVNTRTARTLGLALSPALLARADVVVQ